MSTMARLACAMLLSACQRDAAMVTDACVGCDAAPVPDSAIADCSVRVCGPDGAGGSCGACAAGAFCSSAGVCRTDQLEWSGLVWKPRSGTGGPGPNQWDPRNLWIDELGRLHLAIEFRDGAWTTAELWTPDSYGFGRFQWFVEGAVDQLDRNVVLGLFTYPTAAVGPDTTNEIDIELARWGNAANDPLNFNVWPAQLGTSPTGMTFPMTLSGTYTTHRFEWRTDSIAFGSYHGFRSDNVSPIGTWTYAPVDNTVRIPQAPVPIHINFWLFQGNAPANGQRAEVVLHELTYTAF